MMITSAASAGGVDRFYAARVLAAGAVLWHFRREYAGVRWGGSWYAPAAGLAVLALWMAMEPAPQGSAMNAIPDALARMPRAWAAAPLCSWCATGHRLGRRGPRGGGAGLPRLPDAPADRGGLPVGPRRPLHLALVPDLLAAVRPASSALARRNHRRHGLRPGLLPPGTIGRCDRGARHHESIDHALCPRDRRVVPVVLLDRPGRRQRRTVDRMPGPRPPRSRA